MQITRVCEKCNIEKNIEEFSKHHKCHLGRTWVCLECKRNQQKERYKTTRPPGHISRFRQSKTRGINRAKLHKARSAGCIACGYNVHVVAIDMHHTIGKKEFMLSNSINRCEDDFDNELAKCIPLCSNCHRLFHAGLIILPNTPKESVSVSV